MSEGVLTGRPGEAIERHETYGSFQQRAREVTEQALKIARRGSAVDV